MIAYYTRQIRSLRAGRSGQASVLVVTTVATVLSLVFAAVYVSHVGTAQVAVSEAVDAIALSAATWEARCLNVIAALNDGIVQCLRVIRWTCVVWAALAVSACFGAGMPAFLAYTKRAVQVIRSAWRCAQELADWSMRVRTATPYLVLAETASLSKKLAIRGSLHPFDPRGPHDGENTLELHVAEGPPLTLLDALGPIAKIRASVRKWKWAQRTAGEVLRVVDVSLKAIIGAGGKPIRMLVPEQDFRKRQNVRFVGAGTSSPLPIADRDWSRSERFLFAARAEPYGGGISETTWRSRLIDERGNR